MPRLLPTLVRRAYSFNPLLPLLLRECRDLASARNELRWLQEHVHSLNTANIRGERWRQSKLRLMVQDRSRGKPLQYILGDQPFGELEILCRKGVLIPRPETESYTLRVARLVLSRLRTNVPLTTPFRILDLCTGTGCIPLLLHSLLAPSIPNLTIVGIDISKQALALARTNLEYNICRGHLLPRARQDVHFHQADVLHDGATCGYNSSPRLQSVLSKFISLEDRHKARAQSTQWDILISNPPYISPIEFRNGTTKRSVRLYEPSLALVPPPLMPNSETRGIRMTELEKQSLITTRQDLFYPRLLGISQQINPTLTVLECGDLAQAKRIVDLVRKESRIGRFMDAVVWSCEVFVDSDFSGVDEQEGARAIAISSRQDSSSLLGLK
ncbi:hypothetical protein LOZ58_002680 [Ophidiomyces ophidiicola]|nr:hypothetical protein LOZ58_002680 [Ophidiomyces ophidiicola]